MQMCFEKNKKWEEKNIKSLFSGINFAMYCEVLK